MNTMTVRRCGCGRVLKKNQAFECVDCEATRRTLSGYVHDRGPLRQYPVIPVEECMGKLCALCQNRNTPARAEAMYHHNEGPIGTHWFAHVGCEVQREWDKYEEWRDTADWENEERYP